MTAPLFLGLITLIVMLTFFILIQTHILEMLKLFILQNIILIITMILKGGFNANIEFYFSLTLILIIKTIILPVALWKLIHTLKLSHRVDPLVSRTMLQFIGIFLILFVLLISHHIQNDIARNEIAGFSMLLSNCMLALLLIIFRRKAISQVIGLLVLENSIFILSFVLTSGFPWVIELSIAFDILMSFMIYGLFLLRIGTVHGSLQLHHLEKLKERA